ncbi:MAG TPA: hypothetical protein VIV11_38600 [Kofleriaceae bacterium]
MSMWQVAVALAVTTSGCRFLLGDGPDDNNGADAASAGIDTMIADANTDPKCGWGGSALLQGGICLGELPTTSPTIPSTINTDTSQLCVPYSLGGGSYCVIAGVDLVVPSVRVVGSKPLVLIATATITVNGVVDIASHTTGASGGSGAALDAACNYGTGPTGGANPETRAGGGGSFAGTGGYGGLRNNQIRTDDSGKPGAAIPLAPPTTLRGGCRGQDGNTAPISIGGLGGGAILLAAATSIDVTAAAAINASGAGGNGGATLRGGAGGGSGGMIVLDAPMVNVVGRVFSDGGGGGEGGGMNQPGNDGLESNGMLPARGGSAGSLGGSDGGNGSYLNVLTGQDGGNEGDDSGGGGGGGAGAIWIHAQGGARTGIVSPTPITI